MFSRVVIALLYIVLYDFNFIGKIRRFINRRICVHSLFFRFYFYFSKIKENRIDRIILIQFIENNSAIIHWQIIKKYTIEILILDIEVCRFPILLSTFNFSFFKKKDIQIGYIPTLFDIAGFRVQPIWFHWKFNDIEMHGCMPDSNVT